MKRRPQSRGTAVIRVGLLHGGIHPLLLGPKGASAGDETGGRDTRGRKGGDSQTDETMSDDETPGGQWESSEDWVVRLRES